MENQAAKRIEGPEGDNLDEFGSDRISQLPDSVLHRILCFLSQKKAVQTSVLSKSWRHLGPTRPVIDLRQACDHTHIRGINFCENCFKGNKESFLSVVDSTFQRYHDLNLFAQEVRLEVLTLDLQSQLIPVLEKWILIFMKPNTCVTTFRLTYCHWLFHELPSAVLHAEYLENLYLNGCKIAPIENVGLKNLQKLYFNRVYIEDETLGNIMSVCRFLQYAELCSCEGLETISIKKENQHLKDFKFIGDVKTSVLNAIEIDSPALQSIHIERCLNWKLNRNNYFPHLKSLYLFRVQLSTESFENFSCNFPLLEEFTLHRCSGFEEIKLYCPSLKHLTIDSKSLIKVDIDAPNILRFSFSVKQIPTAISFTTTSRDWKSKITLKGYYCLPIGDDLQRLLWLNEMVKAVSQSQISLDISECMFECMFYQNKQIEFGIHDPVVVEDLNISSSYRCLELNPIPRLFYALFQIIRPRYVIAPNGLQDPKYHNRSRGTQIGEVAACIWETLIHERENKEYYWQKHLEEVSIEAFDYGESVWHRVQGTCLPDNKLIRFGLKWRE